MDLEEPKVTWKPFKSDFVRPIFKNKEKRSVFIENLEILS